MSSVGVGVEFFFLFILENVFLRLIFSFLDKYFLTERLTFKT